MYINGRTVAVLEWVAVHKRRPPFWSLCALPGSAQHRDPEPAVSSGHSETPIVGRDLGPDHVITDWPISDHMQSSNQDVTCDIIAYYV
ncbi:unnamed protein product [Staurois parvus]|uniref:Uncharacterized protein n=1 Tax=Staurois parvus TaxID=386267 RepID=A0ABN9EVW0_9NEOB|nr:unnamed protein product [Staurois parvus]